MRAPAAGLQPMEMSFLGNTLDRQSTRRGDKAYIEGLLQRPDTQFVLSTDKTLVFRGDDIQSIGHSLAEAVALGAETGKWCFSG